MGRPAKPRRSQVASTTLHPALKAEILDEAENADTSEAEVIRLCINEAWPKVRAMLRASRGRRDSNAGPLASEPTEHLSDAGDRSDPSSTSRRSKLDRAA